MTINKLVFILCYMRFKHSDALGSDLKTVCRLRKILHDNVSFTKIGFSHVFFVIRLVFNWLIIYFVCTIMV